MKKFSKLLALCLVLVFLIVCLALGGCKKTETQDPETGGDSGTTTAEQNATGTTASQSVGDQVVLPDDDGDIVVEIEGTTSSSSVGTSDSSDTKSTSGTSSSKAANGSSKTSASQSQSSANPSQNQTNKTPSATKYSRYPGETPIF